MKAHIVCGAPNSGKSTYVKGLLQIVPDPKSIFVYDFQREYYGISKKTGKRFEKLYDPDYKLPAFDEFCNFITKIEGGVIVLEEATIFLDVRGSNFKLREFLLSRYHNKNYIFLLFHSLQDIPKWIFRYVDYVTLLKTNDNAESIRQKFDDRIVSLYETVKKGPQYFHKTVNLYEGV